MSIPRKKPSFRLKSGHTLPQAIAIAKELTRKGLFEIGDPDIVNELAEFGYLGRDEMIRGLSLALSEVTPEDYSAPAEPHKIPGIPFIWNSACFHTRMYLKFKLVGPRPTLWWYSCHDAIKKYE